MKGQRWEFLSLARRRYWRIGACDQWRKCLSVERAAPSIHIQTRIGKPMNWSKRFVEDEPRESEAQRATKH